MARISNTDFGLTEVQKLMRERLSLMLEDVMPSSKIRELDENYQFPYEAYKALADGGWLGLPHEGQYGGLDASWKDFAVFLETIAYHNAQLASAWLTTVMYGGMQVKHGASSMLKEEILPSLIKGDLLLAICLTEPDHGSDVASIRTSARPDGDDFIINGQKVYITCAHVADHLVVATKTDPAARHKGITLFLVDANSPGITIRPLKGLGRRMIHANEVFFSDVRVHASRILGGLNQGWKGLMRGLNYERLALGAAACGNMARIIDYAADYARGRTQFGRKITEFQAISHKFADMQIMAESSRSLLYRVAEMLDAGEDPVMHTSMLKVMACENNVRCADLGMQIMGGAGYMNDHEMQMYYRDSRVGPIGGGTSEIMRSVIAKGMGC